MKRKITLIKVFILLGYIGVPLATIILFFHSPRTLGHMLFFIFMMFHAFERVWETFYTTKEKRADEMHGDWTLAVVTFAYIALCLMTIAESYLKIQTFNFKWTFTGMALYILAFRLRWWGIKSLGKQWAIHAVGVRKIKKIRLIKIGAFRYVRHPIYLSVMMEVISIPLIANAWRSALFAVFINVPLQIFRLLAEEKSSVRRFGDKYQQYKREVSMLIPYKYIKEKLIRHVAR